MKLTLCASKSPSSSSELIELNLKTSLSRIATNLHDTKYLLIQLCRLNRLQYSQQLGAVAAHCATHFHPLKMKQPASDLRCAQRLVDKFGVVFTEGQGQGEGKTGRFKTFEDIVDYASLCVFSSLPQKLWGGSLSNRQSCIRRMKKIVGVLCRSLLLQFVPLQYSSLLLSLYLQQCDSESELQWMSRNRARCESVYPYQDLFQLFCSLGYHIGQTKQLVGFNHFLEVLERPVMGRVEWPIVIGARAHFQLPV